MAKRFLNVLFDANLSCVHLLNGESIKFSPVKSVEFQCLNRVKTGTTCIRLICSIYSFTKIFLLLYVHALTFANHGTVCI